MAAGEIPRPRTSRRDRGELRASQPLRRIGRPEDIAWTTLFLASERAAHITGQLISVSGGAWMP